MIIEQLISHYLDGDLSPEQDTELRQMVAADPSARKSFDEAVLVHIAMRCEDETKVPDGLRAEVFSQVDAIAREDEQLRAATSISRQNRSTTLRRVSAIFAILLAFWVPVHESNFGFSDPATISFNAPLAETPSNDAVPLDTRIAGGSSAATVPQLDVQAPQRIERSDAELLASVVQRPIVHENDTMEPQVTLSSMFKGSGSGSQPPIGSADASPTSRTSPHDTFEGYYQTGPAYVTVSTSYAAGISSSVPTTSNIQQLAASIGFGVTEDDVVGLELGSTSYSYARTSTLTEQTGASVARMSMVNEGGGDSKLASPEHTTGSYETSETSVTGQEQSIWGAAFYERKMLAVDAFNLRGRAGAGVSTGGVVGFGRITGELELTSGVSLVVGAEARAMPFTVGPIQGTGTNKQYGSVFTALTGIHVRF